MKISTNETIGGTGREGAGAGGGGKARDREGRTASAGKICRRLFRTGLE